MRNKLLKLSLLSITIFCFISSIDAAPTSSGSSTGTATIVYSYSSIYGDESPAGYKQPMGCFDANGYNTKMHSIKKYKITSSKTGKKDIAYCIQEAKEAPDSSIKYTLNTEIDVRKCKSIGDKSVPYGACGLAEIMYQINETNNYTKFKNNDSKSYGVITTVMRLWLNYLKNNNSLSSLGSLEDTDYNWKNIDSRYYGRGFYTDVGTYLTRNSNGSLLWTSSSSISVNDWTTGSKNASNCSISGMGDRTNAVASLFRYLVKNKNVKIQDNRFGVLEDYSASIRNTITEEAKYEQTWNITFDVKVNETFVKKFYVKCDSSKESDCYKYIVVQDPTGKNIGYCEGDDIHDGKTCYRITSFPNTNQTSGKDSFIYNFKIYNYKPCELINKSETVTANGYKPSIKFKIGASATGYAKLRVYTPNNSNKQIMVTYIDDYKEFDGKEITTEPDDYTEEFDIPMASVSCKPKCDPNKDCGDLSQKTDIGKTKSNSASDTCETTSSEFQEKSIEDPNMACILNSCDDNNNYDKTSYLKATSKYNYCKGYCREEVKFYVPSPVSVNAGMQFTLDIGKSLIRNKAIDSQIDKDKKLTAVVVRYTQCTTVFDGKNYNNTLTLLRDQFDEADYDLKNKITENKKKKAEADLAKAKSNKESVCASASQCKNTDDDCSSKINACSNATTNVNNLTNQIKEYEELINTYKQRQQYNPGYIKDLQINKEYCLMDNSDEMENYTKKMINEETYLPSGTSTNTIKTEIDNFAASSAKENKLSVEYNDVDKSNIEIESDNKKLSEELKWCVGSNCYKYNTTKSKSSCGSAVSNNFKSNSNSTRDGRTITTKNYKRKLGGYTIGDKIYSTMIVKYQSDYYLNSTYKYKNFTGIISDDGENKLPSYTYPVKIDTETKEKNNIKYKFSNIFTNNSYAISSFDYNCYYNVYNTTKKNNCSFTNGNKVDISQCSNKCYTMTSDGYSTVDKNCITWNTDSKKMGIGIAFRNVDLSNILPVTRTNRSNWHKDELVMIPSILNDKLYSTDNTVKVGDSKTENTVVSVTESGGTDIYNDDHLEASYKLTTETIKGIKSYNRIEQSNGGYLNNTSISCKEVKYPNGGTYYKCGSSFLTNEMKNKYDALIKKGGN